MIDPKLVFIPKAELELRIRTQNLLFSSLMPFNTTSNCGSHSNWHVLKKLNRTAMFENIDERQTKNILVSE